jgi:hypothetical protein
MSVANASPPAVGTRRVYEVDQEGLEAAQRYLGSFWADALARFKGAAERDRPPGAATVGSRP